MRKLLRRAFYRVFGEVTGAHILARVRGRQPTFSESDLLLCLFEKQRRRGLMVDVGAHFGESLLPYLRLGWRVIAFEPDPDNRRELSRNITGDRLRLLPYAVSDQECESVPFYSSDESSGISALHPFRATHREVERVRMTTLRKVLDEQEAVQVDFLKIDTEGHDLFALRGFPFERTKPDAILCEFENAKTLPLGYSHSDIGDFLVQQGYQVLLSEWHPIQRYGVTHQWRSLRAYPCRLADPNAWGNMIALRDEERVKEALSYAERFSKEGS